MKLTINIFFTAVLTLTLAACGSSVTQASNASLPTTTPAKVPGTLPTMTPTVVPVILPTPSSVVPLDERLITTFDINYPDELVFAQGFVWVRTDDGHLMQVDPDTNTVVSDIKVDTTSDPYHYCQGLGTDGENIWVCSASGDEDNRTIDVVRVDPASQSIVATVNVRKIFDQFYMPFLLGRIWVLSGTGDKLIGIDVTTNEPGPAIDLGTRCFHVAAVDKSLLLSCTLDNLVLQIDPEKREVTTRVTVQSPRIIDASENGIWVTQDNAVTRLDPKSLNPVVIFTNMSGVGISGDVFATEEAVWIRQESGFLYQIDPANNQLVEQIKPAQSLTGGSIVVTSDSIWITANEDALLVRISLR